MDVIVIQIKSDRFLWVSLQVLSAAQGTSSSVRMRAPLCGNETRSARDIVPKAKKTPVPVLFSYEPFSPGGPIGNCRDPGMTKRPPDPPPRPRERACVGHRAVRRNRKPTRGGRCQVAYGEARIVSVRYVRNRVYLLVTRHKKDYYHHENVLASRDGHTPQLSL